MLNVAVLISGRGSNLKALLDAMARPGFPARIVTVISNVVDAPGLRHALDAGITSHVIAHRDFKDKASFEGALDRHLTEAGVQLICLAGFMRLLTPWFVERWRDKLINIHPSLLPAFPGLHTHKRALEAGVKFAGCTVHFLRAEMDAGPILLQAAVPVRQDDTEESLGSRVLAAEHVIYPDAVRFIAEGRVNIHEERVFVAAVSCPSETVISAFDDEGLARGEGFST